MEIDPNKEYEEGMIRARREREKNREKQRSAMAQYQDSYEKMKQLRRLVVDTVLEANWSAEKVKGNFLHAAKVMDIGRPSTDRDFDPDPYTNVNLIIDEYAQHIIDTVNSWPNACDEGRRDFLRNTKLNGASPRTKVKRAAAKAEAAAGVDMIHPGKFDKEGA